LATERKRLLELAIRGLENEQSRIQEEIAALRRELGNSPQSRARAAAARAARPKRHLTAEQRKAISQRMKERWAERRRGKKSNKTSA
jgi:hypothetical protein